ncbi:hypothetical protein SAMN02745116_01434 [Pilibacter termitis]|uniref:DUF2187 domain-containing protein n=1 Tax=Pilibacter termitis TaxID=263852 RepID=A0A1T4NJW9_9ENTE|nr:hypothetical protein [Pilibacter termitis]SJZ79038.1 hypothetical protein SAMN02745116_01434 [Pilibacter termitis]
MEVKIGKLYRCHAIGVDGEITGEVMSIYDRVLVVKVEKCSSADERVIVDKLNLVVVKKNDVLSEIKTKAG